MFRVISEVWPPWVLAENVPGVLGFVESVVLPDLETQGYETITIVFPAHALGALHRRERVWIIAYSSSPRRRLSKVKKQGCFLKAGFGDDSAIMANANGKRNTKKISWKKPFFEQSGQFMADAESDGKRRSRATSGKQPRTAGRRSAQSDQDAPNSNSKRFSDRRQTGSAAGKECDAAAYTSIKRCGSSWWAVEPDVGRVAHGVPNRVERLKMLGNGQVVQVVEWIGKQIMNSAK